MRLIEALRYKRASCISFVGAGGKTTALFRIAREILNSAGSTGDTKTVLVSTSTHLGVWQRELADHTIFARTVREIKKLGNDLPAGVVLVTGVEENQRLGRLDEVLLEEVQKIAGERSLPLLIEADGAHNRPLKAPEEHEPVIPKFSQQVVVVVGMKGLGKPLTSEWVHRSAKYSKISGLMMGQEITEEAIVKVMLDHHGGLKAIPSGARRYALLNQADNAEMRWRARNIGGWLIPTYEASIIASLPPQKDIHAPGYEDDSNDGVHAVVEPMGGIILAAGGSNRFGKPKQTLLWRGMPLVRHVALTALSAGLAPVVVVVGCAEDEVRNAIKDLPVRIAKNEQWKMGMSGSIKTGLRALSAPAGGAIFLQSDQPQMPQALIQSLVERHQTTLQPIIAPQIDGQRSNPVLFDSCTFPDLLSLEGDIGGRALFTHYPIDWVAWHDSKLLIDIDTPEDFVIFIKTFPEGEVAA